MQVSSVEVSLLTEMTTEKGCGEQEYDTPEPCGQKLNIKAVLGDIS